MNIPINNVGEAIYLILFILVINITCAVVLYLRENIPTHFENPSTLIGILSSIFFVILGVNLFFFIENDKFENHIDILAGQINNLPVQLSDCPNVKDPLKQYHIQNVINTSMEGIRYAVLLSSLVISIALLVLSFLFFKYKNDDFLWLTLPGVITSTFVGAIALGTVDIVAYIQELVSSTDSVAKKIAEDCTHIDWVNALTILNISPQCQVQIDTYVCAVKDTIVDISNYSIETYTAASWLVAAIPPLLFFTITLTLIFWRKPSSGNPYKKVSPEIKESLF